MQSSCASILRLDSSICCVTRSADGLLENAQRCQPENESIYSNEAPTDVSFKVTSLTDGYEYYLTGNSAYNQLTFPMSGAVLSVVLEKHADAVNLAGKIAKFTKTQNLNQLLEGPEKYPLSPIAEARTHRQNPAR